MRTLTIPETASTPEVTVNVNSDWSGSALLSWREFGERVSVEISAAILLSGSIPRSCTINRDILCVVIAACVRDEMRCRAVAAMEDL